MPLRIIDCRVLTILHKGIAGSLQVGPCRGSGVEAARDTLTTALRRKKGRSTE